MNATQAIDSIVKLLGLQFKKESFKSTFLEDGTEVTNNMDGEFEVGQTLYVVKESTLTPAPAGQHLTREKLVLTVDEESTIIAIASEDVEKTEVEVEVEGEMKDMKMTIAEDAQGQKLESATFDVGEDVYLIKEDGSKVPAPNGEHQVVLKDESGNENKIRIEVMDGKIVQRENVEGMMKPEMMNADFSKDITDIKESLSKLIEVMDNMNGKFKTELSSLKSDFDTFKKSPERTPVDEKKTYGESFSDYRLDIIKQLRNK